MLTMDDASVLIPFRTDGGPRERIFEWMKRYYETYLPDTELCVGESVGEVFCKPEAINQAANKASGTVFVIADADVVYDVRTLCQAIGLLKKYPCIIPYDRLYQLTRDKTRQILTQPPCWPLATDLEYDKVYRRSVGGVNVLARSTFQAIGGCDGRFLGWGPEDKAFVCALDTLCGPHHRISAPMYHLWHPTAIPRAERKRDCQLRANRRLYRRYRGARNTPEAMRSLIGISCDQTKRVAQKEVDHGQDL